VLARLADSGVSMAALRKQAVAVTERLDDRVETTARP